MPACAQVVVLVQKGVFSEGCNPVHTYRWRPLPVITAWNRSSVQGLLVAMVWPQLWLHAVCVCHIPGVAGMSKAVSSSSRLAQIHGAQSVDDLPSHVVPLSRLRPRVLRYD